LPYGLYDRENPSATIATENNKIILLDELFNHYPDKIMNIDLKTHTEAAAKELARLVNKHKREEVTVWGSISDKTKALLYTLDPSVTTIYSPSEIAKLFLLTISGLLPFWTLKPGVV
jgi:hypothetical protein